MRLSKVERYEVAVAELLAVELVVAMIRVIETICVGVGGQWLSWLKIDGGTAPLLRQVRTKIAGIAAFTLELQQPESAYHFTYDFELYTVHGPTGHHSTWFRWGLNGTSARSGRDVLNASSRWNTISGRGMESHTGARNARKHSQTLYDGI